MFKITDNMFGQKGVCKYRDEYGNTAFMKRTEDGFVAKIRYADKNVSSPALNICVPLKETTENGIHMSLDFHNSKAYESEDLSGGIKSITELIQRWIQMLYDIKFMECPSSIIKKSNNADISEKDIAEHKIAILMKYEELNSMITSIFPDSTK